MKYLKAEWGSGRVEGTPTHTVTPSESTTLTDLIAQHNTLIDYQKEYEERVEIITNDLLERVGKLEEQKVFSSPNHN